jgi:outer membrane lipoprotein SlyB
MQSSTETKTIREAVAIFHDAAKFEAAVDELLSSGFDRADLSLIAGENAVAKKLGHMYRKASEVEDSAEVPRAAYVEHESFGDAKGAFVGGLSYLGAMVAAGALVASGGTIAGAIVAAALAGSAGGLIGSVFGDILEDRHAEHLKRQLDRGGLLLWVRTATAAREKQAKVILARHSADDVHIHDIAA